jgi:predicted nucleic acid-binding protein
VKWLLDTSTLSEVTKANPSPEVIDWLDANETDSAISAISIGEMVAGVEQMFESKRRRSLARALKFLREDYAGKILDFTEGAAVEWGRLIAQAKKAGRNLPVIDSQIEATAIHFRLIVVTGNTKDFLNPVFNPWHATRS